MPPASIRVSAPGVGPAAPAEAPGERLAADGVGVGDGNDRDILQALERAA